LTISTDPGKWSWTAIGKRKPKLGVKQGFPSITTKLDAPYRFELIIHYFESQSY